MKCFHISLFTIFALLECSLVVTSFPAEDETQKNVTYNAILDRPKRQSDDKGLSLALVAAIGALACRAPTTTPKPEPKKCKINVKQLKFTHPLIVDPYDRTKFLYPDDNGDIFFNENDPVFLSCADREDSQNKNAFQNIPNVRNETFFCVCDDNFRDNARVYSLYNDLQCNAFPKNDIVDEGLVNNVADIDNKGLSLDYHRYAIGFYTDDKNFLKIIEIIYYDEFSVSWYAKSEVSKHLAGGQAVAKAKSMFDQKFCCHGKNIDMEDVYNKDKQIASFDNLLKRNTYLRKDNLFNRGHLTPKSSMVYTPAARATFAYLNVAPQWLKINSGNWGRIEEHILEMAKILKRDLTVYTGVYEGLLLKDTGDGDQLKPTYLRAVKNAENVIVKDFPIPLYFYKLVLDLEARKGVVYVTVNNPFIDFQKASEYHICNNPIIKQDGVKMPKQWKPKSIELGYSYMCYVDDFLAKTKMLPVDMNGIGISDLLYIPGPVATTTPTTTTTFKRFHDELRK